jgi:glycosyltransferase involved in cell wall biosynthesis
VKVALIHDWLTGMRGGERALLAFCELLPDADLFTLVRVPGATDPIIERRRVRTSALQMLPFPRRLYRHYLPFFPTAIELFDLDRYDLVLSTSHCAAKSVVVPGRARHICYCLTPMRYAWDQFDSYFGPQRVGAPVSRLMRPVMAALARWDRATSSRVDRYLAISQYVARRIALYYNRASSVVYPPVETSFYTPGPDAARPPAAGEGEAAGGSAPGDRLSERLLVVSALVPYKRVDLAIAAARRAGVALTIVGDGPERTRLEAAAGGSARFLGWRTNEEIRTLYRSTAATLLPGEEDFGIVPLEAQACGRPVIALGRGGARETILDGETGLLVEPGESALVEGIRRALARPWDRDRIRRHAERFSRARFDREIREVIDETLSAPPGHRW